MCSFADMKSLMLRSNELRWGKFGLEYVATTKYNLINEV